MQACRCAQESVTVCLPVVQSPGEQSFDKNQVITISIWSYHYFRFHTRDALADSEPVESPELFGNEPKPMASRHFSFPWKFVSAQLKNSKGDEIFFPVNDERDREWARRLEWVVGKHRDLAEPGRAACRIPCPLRESRESLTILPSGLRAEAAWGSSDSTVFANKGSAPCPPRSPSAWRVVPTSYDIIVHIILWYHTYDIAYNIIIKTMISQSKLWCHSQTMIS